MRYRAGYSHDVSIDSAYLYSEGYTDMVVLTKPLTIGKVYFLMQGVFKHRETVGAAFVAEGGDRASNLVQRKIKGLKKAAAGMGLSASTIVKDSYEIRRGRKIGCPPGELEQLVPGRVLFCDEIVRFMGTFKKNREVADYLQLMYLKHECRRMPGVGRQPNGRLSCFRCGQSDGVRPVTCVLCGEDCFECASCGIMGGSRSCQALYMFPPGGAVFSGQRDIVPRLEFSLSCAQEKAAQDLESLVLGTRQRGILVWAACGAGKTEITFSSAAWVLSRGGRVLYTAPRRSAVEEIFSRLEKAFPGVRCACLHGGVDPPSNLASVPLIAATTHQVLRFHSAFSLIILDEMDAYPYIDSPLLQFAVSRALKPGGRMVMMTATPPVELVRGPCSATDSVIKIPARFHGYPLPEPVIIVIGPNSREVLPGVIKRIIHETLEEDAAQLLVFVPSVADGFETKEALQKELDKNTNSSGFGRLVEFSHSRDEEREQKLQRFKNREFPVLVATTILERGVNIPRVNVLVLHAHRDNIFETRTLVQLAGRAGRFPDYPAAKVWFLGSRKTRSMREACNIITHLNEEAIQKGFLNDVRKGAQVTRGFLNILSL